MKVFEKIAEIQQEVGTLLNENKTIGFVPTMGALHEGHISLITNSKQDNDITISSIFVNPIQFNNPNDLRNYPRTLQEDLKKLEAAGCDIVFAPSVEEMYPKKVDETYNFGSLESVMEGKFRPGHFNGVAVVVKRLFEITTPTRAYFGQKDFQQLAIIKALVKQTNSKIEIVECPTIRESDGLAMSSRNTLLSEERRKSACLISQVLFQINEVKNSKTIDEIKTFVNEKINSDEYLEVEYFEIVDSQTLQPINSWEDSKTITACIAVHNGNVRLIDNISL